MKKDRTRILVCIAAAWFLFLCLLHYFAQHLGVDEPEVLQNLKEKSIPQLFGALNYRTIFPRFYLALISFLSGHFSYNTLSLQFLPLLFMIAGFAIWLYLYAQESKTAPYLFLAVFSFSNSLFTTYYAASLKQYSCDLFIVAFFTAFLYYQKKYFKGEGSLKYLWFFSVAAPLLMTLSQISFFVFWIAGYNYLFFLKKDKKVRLPFAVYTVLVIASCLVTYWFDMRFSLKMKALSMQGYWKDTFIDVSSLYRFSKTFTNGLQSLMVRWFLENRTAKIIANIFMPFCLVAIGKSFWVSLKKHKGRIFDVGSLCGVLILELIVLAALKLYPFTGQRPTLFIAPFIFLMFVRGIYLTEKIKVIFYPLVTFYIVFLSGVGYYLLCTYLELYKR